MQPLIDADVLRYEIGYSCEIKNEEGVKTLLPFDSAIELLENKIDIICSEVEATKPPILFLSSNKFMINNINRRLKLSGEPLKDFKPNFREKLATIKKYKGTRVPSKPYYYNALTMYIMDNYKGMIANGLEADDLLTITQYNNKGTIICTRDKDLRMCPGWHYSWECGTQPSIGPIETDNKGFFKTFNNKIKGFGTLFFLYQLIVGDTIDNIEGIKGYGPKKAFEVLTGWETKSLEELYEEVIKAYKEAYKEVWKEHLLENEGLLWMIREIDKNGSPIYFNRRYLQT